MAKQMESSSYLSEKELLSKHVENIFKTYTSSGLHICDIATGGGKIIHYWQINLRILSQAFQPHNNPLRSK